MLAPVYLFLLGFMLALDTRLASARFWKGISVVRRQPSGRAGHNYVGRFGSCGSIPVSPPNPAIPPSRASITHTQYTRLAWPGKFPVLTETLFPRNSDTSLWATTRTRSSSTPGCQFCYVYFLASNPAFVPDIASAEQFDVHCRLP